MDIDAADPICIGQFSMMKHFSLYDACNYINNKIVLSFYNGKKCYVDGYIVSFCNELFAPMFYSHKHETLDTKARIDMTFCIAIKKEEFINKCNVDVGDEWKFKKELKNPRAICEIRLVDDIYE